MKNVFFMGHRVQFTYDHYLNSKSFTVITKNGTLVRQVRTGKLKHPNGFWMVKFDGNKSLSRIHESRLSNLTMNGSQ